MRKVKLPSELAAAVGARAYSHTLYEWDGPYNCYVKVKHIACGKTYTTRMYRKRETAKRNAEKWASKHSDKCPKTIKADAAFKAAEGARRGAAR